MKLSSSATSLVLLSHHHRVLASGHRQLPGAGDWVDAFMTPTDGTVLASPKDTYGDDYLGCWEDLADPPAMDYKAADALGVDSCRTHCREKGYDFAGLQWKSECWCGDDYDEYGEASESECNLECSEQSGATCGGISFMSVYTSDEPVETPSPTKEPTVSPTTEEPTAGTPSPTTEEPTVVSPSPTTEEPTPASPMPTTEEPTAGTAGPDTLVPSTAPPISLGPTTEAPVTNAPTTSSPTTKAPTTALPTTDTPTAWSTTERPSTEKTEEPPLFASETEMLNFVTNTQDAMDDSAWYAGCWKDGNDRVFERWRGLDHTIDTCISICQEQGHKYAGLQRGTVCWCGDSYWRHGKAPESECNRPCDADTSQICGGSWRNSVYRTGGFTDSSIMQHYFGCWQDDQSDRALTGARIGGGNWDIESCMAECKNRGFWWAGLQWYGNSCSCGNDNFWRHGWLAHDKCDTPCNGNTDQMCGGAVKLSIYDLRFWNAPTPAPVAPPPTTTRPTPSPGGGGSGDAFDMTLELQNLDSGVYNNFVSAKNKWEAIITEDAPQWSGWIDPNWSGANPCDSSGYWPTTVDDVYICGYQTYIDGPGNVLGSAGPVAVRGGSGAHRGVPIAGFMRFDSADHVTYGTILHEMGHVLGLGTVWEYLRLTPSGGSRTTPLSCHYKEDSRATEEFRSLTGCSGVAPVEMSTGRSGSDCGHWSDSCFHSERLTFNGGGRLSTVTIGTMEDIGWTGLDYSQADYRYDDLGDPCLCKRRGLRGGGLGENATLLDAMEEMERMEQELPPHRQLSEEGKAAAEAYGKLHFASIGTTAAGSAQDAAFSVPGGDEYYAIGRDVVMVFYEENGEVHGVMVRND